MKRIKNEHGTYLYKGSVSVGFTDEKDTFILNGRYVSKIEFDEFLKQNKLVEQKETEVKKEQTDVQKQKVEKKKK